MRGILLGVCLLVACGGSDEARTLRDAVIDVCDALCDRSAECGDDVSDCYDGCPSLLCEDIDCGSEFTGSQADLDDCVDAWADHPCSSDTLPAECNAVIR